MEKIHDRPFFCLVNLHAHEVDDTYERPACILAIADRSPYFLPLAALGRTALFEVEGGYIIEDGNRNERFIYMNGFDLLMHTTTDIASRPARYIDNDLHIIHLNDGYYLRTDGYRMAGSHENKELLNHVQELFRILPNLNSAHRLLQLTESYIMPTGKIPLGQYKEENSYHSYPMPVRPSAEELKFLFDPARLER